MRGYDEDERAAWHSAERGREDWRERGGRRGYDDDDDDWRRAGRHREEGVPFSSRGEYEAPMLGNSVASVWEITAQSRHSFEDAIRYGIHRARQTLRHIKGVWVQGQEVLLRSNEIYAYRVQLKVTFVLEDR
jgi:hypothetical protein